MNRSHKGIPAAYILYGVAFFVLLVLIILPYDRFLEALVSRFEDKTGIDVTYQNLDYCFPAGCRFENIEIFVPLPAGKVRAYTGKNLLLKTSMLSLFKKGIQASFQGQGFGGEVKGTVHLMQISRPETGTYHLQVVGLQIEEIMAPFYLRNFKVNGKLTGEADFSFQGKDYAQSGTGTLHASLNQGQIRNILVQGMELPDFAFETIQAQATLEKGKLLLESCHLDSEILLAELEGEIELNPKDIRDSRLILSARLKPLENDPINLHGVATFYNKTLDSEGYYPFQLSGTFRFPELN